MFKKINAIRITKFTEILLHINNVSMCERARTGYGVCVCARMDGCG